MSSYNHKQETVDLLKKRISSIDKLGKNIISSTPVCIKKTNGSKLKTCILISATATRGAPIPYINLSSATQPCMEAHKKSEVLSPESGASSALNLSRNKNRLPLNMVVSEVATRRGNPSLPARPMVRKQPEYTHHASPTQSSYIEEVLAKNVQGPKIGSLPHPDDIMVTKSHRSRQSNSSNNNRKENAIHNAFLSIYGNAEAMLSANKKLRLNSRNAENDDSLTGEEAEAGCSNPHRLLMTNPSQEEHYSVHEDYTVATNSNRHYDELYGSVCSSVAPDCPNPLLALTAVGTPKNWVFSNNFLRTVDQEILQPPNPLCDNFSDESKSAETRSSLDKHNMRELLDQNGSPLLRQRIDRESSFFTHNSLTMFDQSPNKNVTNLIQDSVKDEDFDFLGEFQTSAYNDEDESEYLKELASSERLSDEYNATQSSDTPISGSPETAVGCRRWRGGAKRRLPSSPESAETKWLEEVPVISTTTTSVPLERRRCHSGDKKNCSDDAGYSPRGHNPVAWIKERK